MGLGENLLARSAEDFGGRAPKKKVHREKALGLGERLWWGETEEKGTREKPRQKDLPVEESRVIDKRTDGQECDLKR